MGSASVMIYYAYTIYVKRSTRALEDDEVEGGLHRLFANKYWIDELYDAIIRKPVDALGSWFGKLVEPRMIDGAVEGSGRFTKWSGDAIRVIQSGSISTYILAIVAGVIAMLIWLN